MEHKEDYFEGGKNHKIFYQSWIPEKPVGIVQIIHGGVEHVGRYKHLVKFLTENNYAAYGNDHRGHGKSEGRRNHIMDHDEFVDDCYTLTTMIKKEHKDIPFFIVGHSMGSFIAQRYIIKYPTELNGLVLSGSGIKMPPLPKILQIIARIMYKVFPTFKAASGINPEEISSDPESVEDYINDPLIDYKKATAGYGICMLDHYKYVKGKLGNIKIPVLIQRGELDTMIIGLDELKNELKDAEITVRIYDKGKHEMYTETKEKREQAFSDLVLWLNKLI
jgi:alpha-beta hydrolase superfamily lysophospholipase